MCGRYVSKTQAAWERSWSLNKAPPLFESYNIAPSTKVPVIRAIADGRDCDLIRWGLIPCFAKGVATKYSTINARVETIKTSPAYRAPWKRGQRCIIPALGFYEWHVEADGRKQPFYIHLADQEVFGFAGVWDRSVKEDGESVDSCTIITMPANELMADIHNVKARMPAILRTEDHDAWLSGSADAAETVLTPYPSELMVAHPVSTRVNTPKNTDAKLIDAVG
jgi:putative SOS response-associated peptidase YedK